MLVDRTGLRYGRLLVLSRAESAPGQKRATRWLCRCDCGVEKVIRWGMLQCGDAVSCGCYNRDKMRALARSNRTHSHSTKEGGKSPTYQTWASMVQRCTNPNRRQWMDYGGRGIRLCESWRTFANFLADMGERPSGTSLDRINNDGHYEPSNCRWTTRRTQNRNRRSTKLEPHEPAQIRWLRTQGYRNQDVAQLFGVSPSLVQFIIKGTHWK